MLTPTCSKCGSQVVRVEEDHTGFFSHCYCGKLDVIQVKFEHTSITDEEKIPRLKPLKSGSLCALIAEQVYLLGQATTGQIVERVKEINPRKVTDGDQISSLLTSLRIKGVVERMNNMKGMSGGSTWTTTAYTKEYLGV